MRLQAANSTRSCRIGEVEAAGAAAAAARTSSLGGRSALRMSQHQSTREEDNVNGGEEREVGFWGWWCWHRLWRYLVAAEERERERDLQFVL